MAGIPREVIDELRARVDIVELIQAYVPLKKNGRDFLACCPFHQEKTPSFRVNPQYQHYHCFGCGKNGNIFSFVMDHENVDFPTAVRIIAQRYGVMIPEEDRRYSRKQYPRQNDDESAPSDGSVHKDRLYKLHELIAKWYQRCLENNPDSPVAEYLEKRHLAPESLVRFGIGASLDSSDACQLYAKSQGFTERELLAGGLMKMTDDRPPRKYDMFRNRLMFPIHDATGRVVGFSARTIESDPKMMKYVNTPETPIFRKGRLLYGLHLARPEMAEGRRNCAILCEGQLDVIAMHEAGFTNAVAAEGTAFTQEQARILRPSTENMLLALDSDGAGRNALFKDAKILLPLGFKIKVVTFPGGKDPDELLRKQGKEAIEKAVNEAEDLFEFAYRYYSEQNGTDPRGSSMTAEALLELIALMESAAGQSVYLSWLSKKMDLLPEGLQERLNLILSRNASMAERYREYELRRTEEEKERKQEKPQENGQDPYLRKALLETLELALENRNAAQMASAEIQADFSDGSPLFRALEQVIQAAMLEEWDNARDMVFKSLQDVSAMDPELSELLTREELPSLPDRQAVPAMQECIFAVCKCCYDRSVKEKMTRFAQLAPEDPARNELMAEINVLVRKRAALKRKPADRIAPVADLSHDLSQL